MPYGFNATAPSWDHITNTHRHTTERICETLSHHDHLTMTSDMTRWKARNHIQPLVINHTSNVTPYNHYACMLWIRMYAMANHHVCDGYACMWWHIIMYVMAYQHVCGGHACMWWRIIMYVVVIIMYMVDTHVCDGVSSYMWWLSSCMRWILMCAIVYHDVCGGYPHIMSWIRMHIDGVSCMLSNIA